VTFWFLFYKAFVFLSKTEFTTKDIQPAVSVIVCYKNAKQHLHSTIQSILNQQYPTFELIANDDFSIDGSSDTLKHINDDRLTLLTAVKDTPGKKSALTQAILHAKNELLLFTDADCIPASTEWIKSMVSTMMQSEDTEIVLGYGPMNKTQECLNAFVRYETILTALQYMSYAVFRIPYMGVGRNLMYKKSLFLQHNGFKSHENIASGDDDLMISKIATEKNTIVNLKPESFVYSDGKNNLLSFLNQKSRHVTTSVHYNNIHKILLFIFAFAQLGFYLLFVLLLAFGNISPLSLVLFLSIKWSVQMTFQQKAIKLLIGKDLYWRFPLLDVGMVIYYMTLPLYSFFRKGEW
jgi:glycosyltransferase involved in cell wall biosynthesis